MSALPPGPPFALLQTARLVKDPYSFHRACRARYGDPYTVPSLNGKVVCTGDPEGIREIFAADPDTFAPWAADTLRPMLGDGSIIVLRGERHKRERKLLMPPFQGERMRAYGALMVDVARRHFARRNVGEVFRFLDTAQAISLEVIVRAVFGVEDDAAVERMASAVTRFASAASPLVMFTKLLQHQFGGFGPWARLTRLKADYDALLLTQIRARRAGATGDDILSILLAARYEDGQQMSDDDIRAELVTLLFAGHETTALALSWAVYWLLRDPARLAQLRAELDAAGSDPDTIARLPYLEALCLESLRIHPILPDPLREVIKPFRLRGYDVPIGCGVAAVSGLAHEDPAIFEEPMAFRPERFLARTFKPYEYFPFGGGSRRCIGAAFAVHEMKLVLAALFSEHELELCEPREVRPARRNVTMGPSTGIRVRRVGPRRATPRA
jgi:cytochrome P450